MSVPKRKPKRRTVSGASKVVSGRLQLGRLKELKRLYPGTMTESEILSDLVNEKLARAQFDRWMEEQATVFDEKDFDSESLR